MRLTPLQQLSLRSALTGPVRGASASDKASLRHLERQGFLRELERHKAPDLFSRYYVATQLGRSVLERVA